MLIILTPARTQMKCKDCDNTNLNVYHEEYAFTEEAAKETLIKQKIKVEGFSSRITGNIVVQCTICKAESKINIENIQPRLEIFGSIVDG